MSPPNADTSGAGAETDPPEAARGSLEVGGYVLDVGGAGGTVVQRSAGRATEDTEALEQALEEEEPKGEAGVASATADAVDDASEMTAKIERAVALGKGAAEGKTLSPDQLALEVGTLLGLLERLDRRERYKEALRLARALANLFMLLRRWVELLRTLRTALRAGKKLDDAGAIGWAEHELGTLRLAAGDVKGAERNLREAREIRERIGDQRGLTATNRNLQVLCKRLREMLRDGELVRPRSWWHPSLPQLVSLAVLCALAFGGGLGAGVIAGDSNEDGTTGFGGDTTNNPSVSTTNEPTNGTGEGESFLLKVTIAGDGGGTVKGGGIECPAGPCEAELRAGEEVTLEATADEKSFFAGFSAVGCSGTGPCILTMDEAKTVIATFDSATEPSPVIKEEALPEEEKSAASPAPSEVGE